MSLFGKILAVLNIVGALALVVIATMSLGKRQEFSQNVLRHEVVLAGLPLDDQEMDKNNRTLKDRLVSGSDDSTYKKFLGDLFSPVGGNPVETRTEEAKKLQGLLEEKLKQAATNEGQDSDKSLRIQSHILARVLLHFAVTNADRDRMRSALTYMANEAGLASLRNRYKEAFASAKAPPVSGLADQTFADAFRLAVRKQPGEPSDQFTESLIALLPDTREKAKDVKFDDIFSKGLEDQLDDLRKRSDLLFKQALGETTDGLETLKPAWRDQKHAVARLMFGMSQYLAEEDLEGEGASEADKKTLEPARKGSIDYAMLLPATDAFKKRMLRTYIVNGLNDTLDVVTERTFVLRELAANLKTEMTEERNQFARDQAYEVNRVRAMMGVLRSEVARLTDAENQANEARKRLGERKEDVLGMEGKLEKTLTRASATLAELQRTTQRLLDARVKAADTIRKTSEAGTHLRYLEKLARDSENKNR